MPVKAIVQDFCFLQSMQPVYLINLHLILLCCKCHLCIYTHPSAILHTISIQYVRTELLLLLRLRKGARIVIQK